MKAGGSSVLAVRALLYFAVWIVVDQSTKPANLVVGALASVAAAWLSLRLLPPARGRIRLGLLVALLPRFLWQSLVAGVDVARRALAPRLDLEPGFVDYPTRLPPGDARTVFEVIASLMPGSVPSDGGPQHIEFHCLDTRQPVAAQLAAEEGAYAPALQGQPRDG
ncbi:MAG: Na+/H+ antiporter subunit E [Chromatiales bacterium]|jgi:multicomponent Na+:H+ antiporter subunit E|nr:Na+/H+ antiporter subunit E [Chromatiales bacterium]